LGIIFFPLQSFNVFLLLKENPVDALEIENEVLRSGIKERDTLTSHSFYIAVSANATFIWAKMQVLRLLPGLF